MNSHKQWNSQTDSLSIQTSKRVLLVKNINFSKQLLHFPHQQLYFKKCIYIHTGFKNEKWLEKTRKVSDGDDLGLLHSEAEYCSSTQKRWLGKNPRTEVIKTRRENTCSEMLNWKREGKYELLSSLCLCWTKCSIPLHTMLISHSASSQK